MENFDAYVTGRALALTRFAYLLCGDRHLAEDIVQEVLGKVSRRWPRIVASGSPEPYVRAAIVRQSISWRRRRSSSERPMADPPEPAPSGDPAGHHADRDEVWTALASLPRQQRAVLVLRHYEDLGDAQIAEILGCAPSTVRVHAARALASLHTRLNADHTGVTHA